MKKLAVLLVSFSIIILCALAVFAEKIYFGDIGNDKIKRCNLNGSNIEELVATSQQAVGSIAIDRTGGKMYWTDWSGATAWIKRSNLDGTNIETLLTGLGGPYGVALDVVSSKMYWTEFSSQKIRRANLDGSNVEDLIASGLSHPNGIALDLAGRKMYWGDGNLFGKIQRADLDGTNIETLVTAGLSSPMEIALDVAAGKMYWADLGTGKIQCADLTGGNLADLIAFEFGSGAAIDLDTSAGKIYYSDFGGGGSKIKRSNLDGTAVEDVIVSGIGASYGLSLGPQTAECGNASLLGPWLLVVSGVETYDYAAYLMFDGLGTITEMGSFNVPFPAGTYSVMPDCSMSGTFWSDGYVPFTGHVYSDTTGDIGPMPLLKVRNPAALQGCWAGSFVQDSTLISYNVNIYIDASGGIQSATGFPLPVSGKIFYESDYLAGHILTGAVSEWEEIMLMDATVLNDSLMTGTFVLDCGGCRGGRFDLVHCTPVSGAGDVVSPRSIYLEQNYPNPFNPGTMIKFGIENEGRVSLKIYDVSGRLVRTLVDERRYAAAYVEEWNGLDDNGRMVGSGVYFVKLKSGAYAEIRKMVLSK